MPPHGAWARVWGGDVVSRDDYRGIADRYDLFHGEFRDHDPEVVSFFLRLFSEHRVESVLDCACGTGGHLHLFHTLGCEVVGSDLSPAMLDRAKRNLIESGADVPLFVADYRQLAEQFERRFDAVVCLSSSILHMPDDEQAVRALRSMRSVLRRGGIMVLTQGTSDKQWREKPRFILAINTERFSRLFVIDYEGAGARYNILDVFHGHDERGMDVWSVEYPRMLLRDDYERLLTETGFRGVEFYGTYGFAPYDAAESDRLIAVAH